MITLKKAIDNSGLKKKTISAKVGVSITTLKNWSNKKTEPNVTQAEKLAEVLNIDISELIYFFSHNVS